MNCAMSMADSTEVVAWAMSVNRSSNGAAVPSESMSLSLLESSSSSDNRQLTNMNDQHEHTVRVSGIEPAQLLLLGLVLRGNDS